MSDFGLPPIFANKYGSLIKLKRVIAYEVHFLDHIRSRISKNNRKLACTKLERLIQN
jgi:hypothetical protein